MVSHEAQWTPPTSVSNTHRSCLALLSVRNDVPVELSPSAYSPDMEIEGLVEYWKGPLSKYDINNVGWTQWGVLVNHWMWKASDVCRYIHGTFNQLVSANSTGALVWGPDSDMVSYLLVDRSIVPQSAASLCIVLSLCQESHPDFAVPKYQCYINYGHWKSTPRPICLAVFTSTKFSGVLQHTHFSLHRTVISTC